MEEFQTVKLQKFRIRTKYSLFPFILVGAEFVWTGKWGKYVNITEQLEKYRYKNFDGGYSYQWYWSEWKYEWKFFRINE